MAKAHEAWIAELLHEISAEEIDHLLAGLGRLKASLRSALEPMEPQ
jgi:hypothetical protein